MICNNEYMTSVQGTIKSGGIQYDAFTRDNICILANDWVQLSIA